MWWLTLSRPDLPRVNPLDGPRVALNTQSMISIEIGLGDQLHCTTDLPINPVIQLETEASLFVLETKYELYVFLNTPFEVYCSEYSLLLQLN